ncbi:SLAP domain-containing protein [Companilactobacillus kedongensis]|uniref:SLAP domain-containing protein n=1 Tax=Companilactobacillus kedongensis TaxID=2486004 RepID=UPI000F777F94|nr:SLAP domain-containing protein [Companilactobacillus kedongensis]
MRFQQLKRDSNSVMKKKLVKSKKNWVVVSSLSLAGGLFLLGTPTYVAKAATTDTIQTALSQAAAESPTPTDGLTDAAGSGSAAGATDGSGTSSTGDTGDGTKDGSTGAGATGTQAQQPAANGGSESGSTGTGSGSTTGDNTPAPSNGAGSTDPQPASDGTGDGSTGETAQSEQPTAQAFSVEGAPVATATKTMSGTGWTTDGTTLTINGQLDETTKDYPDWGGNASTITAVVVKNAITAPKDSSHMFASMPLLNSVDISKMDTSNVDSTEGMFANDTSLLNLDLSQNLFTMVTNLSHMFENDHKLTKISFPLGAFTKIIDGSYAFANCENLSEIAGPDVGGKPTSATNNWIANNATDLRAMFKNDASLNTINLYGWKWTNNRPSSEWPKTGDSSLGEGMFDGTNLDSISLSSSLYFNPKTMLTSSNGPIWQSDNSNTTKSFYGVPQTNPASGVSNGLGALFNGIAWDSNNNVLTFDSKGSALAAGSDVTNHVTIKTNHGDIVQDIKGTVGDPGTIDIPGTYKFANGNTYTRTSTATSASFTFGQTMATATASDGADVTYEALPATSGKVTATTSDGSSITFTVPADGYHVGDTGNIDITTDPIKSEIASQLPAGYHIADGTTVGVTFTNNPDTPVTVDAGTTVALVGNDATDKSYDVTLANGDTVSTPLPAGAKVGDHLSFAPKTETGYKPNIDNITGTIDTSGKFVPDKDLVYTGNDATDKSYDVTLANGDTVSTPLPAGAKVGDHLSFAPKTETGYTTNLDTVYGTIDPSGKFVPDKDLVYTGNDATDKSYDVTLANGDTVSTPLPAGAKVGDHISFAPKTETGYTTNLDTVYGTIDPSGKFVPDKDLVYTGDTIGPTDITIPSTVGQQSIDQPIHITGGKVGDTQEVNLPNEDGYTTPKITVTYGPNNTFTFSNTNTKEPISNAKYIGTPNKATTITFTKPDGSTQVINVPAGNYGDKEQTYTADPVNGYTSPSVIVTYTIGGVPTITYANDPNKTVTDTDKLTYTPIPTSSGNTDTPENGDIEYKNQTISTYADKPAVALYQLGADGKMTKSTTRSLATATDWQSDAVITIDGVGYYRVSTNEWALMSQAYPYTAPNVYVRAYSDSAKELYKAESDLIKTRSLAPNSSWIADHQTYVINGTKHFRVSTNEFVDESDVYVYTPVNMVVTTHAKTTASLYTAKGDLVTNRSLSANSSWKTDSITTINGEQYYRVSTNEFVKAVDVDVNN